MTPTPPGASASSEASRSTIVSGSSIYDASGWMRRDSPSSGPPRRRTAIVSPVASPATEAELPAVTRLRVRTTLEIVPSHDFEAFAIHRGEEFVVGDQRPVEAHDVEAVFTEDRRDDARDLGQNDGRLVRAVFKRVTGESPAFSGVVHGRLIPAPAMPTPACSTESDSSPFLSGRRTAGPTGL